MPLSVNKLGCTHYQRKCLIICNKCSRAYPCHACHDNIEDHHLSRFEVTKIVCILCGSTQSKANVCIKCGCAFANYFCEPCSIWSDGCNIFHCSKCSLCRVGTPEMLEHCEKCESCIERGTRPHNHVSGGARNNCPICAEHMFDTPKQVVLLRCGHSLHEECYAENIKSSIHCPICFKLVGDDTAMRSQIKAMVEGNRSEGPPQDGKGFYVSCFECGDVGFAKMPCLLNACFGCGSYNTKIKNDQ